jgi:signal transduction histidine kinase
LNAEKTIAANALNPAAEAALTPPLAEGEKQHRRFVDRLKVLLAIPAPDTQTLLYRVRFMERDIVLPAKLAAIVMLISSFYFSPWIGITLGSFEIAVESTQYFLGVYIAVNLAAAAVLLNMYRVPIAVLEWTIFIAILVDAIFLSSLTLVTGGYESTLFWLFLAIVIRNATSVPRPTSQLTLNLTLTACYLLAGAIEIGVSRYLDESQKALDESQKALMEISENSTETLLLRMALLVFMTFSCYAIQVFLYRQRQSMEQARELAVREAQLQSAGRFAAEFAHQIKNPLAIINNAAFSISRALREGRGDPQAQVRIIQEEVERSDRIITDVMGYAQLTEGRVEKLDVIVELENAISQVFPPKAGYPIKLRRDYATQFPPLLAQRRHVNDIFVNLLQNARESLGEKGGQVLIRGVRRADLAIEITIGDNGPGIPLARQAQIFEAYYTTKPTGTGLGLATVKNKVELYGGTIRVESELGKGSRFILSFPARSLIRLENRI